MATLRHVNPNYVCQLWPQVADMLAKALETGCNEYNADQLKAMLTQGKQALLVADDGGKIVGACSVELIPYPNDFMAFVTAIGGRMVARKDLYEQLCAWAKGQGCTKIRGAAGEAVARLWRQRFGVEEIYRIVEKAL